MATSFVHHSSTDQWLVSVSECTWQLSLNVLRTLREKRYESILLLCSWVNNLAWKMIPPASGQISGKSLQTMEPRKFHSGLTPNVEKTDKAVFKTFATLNLLSSEPRINNMFASWELLQVKQTFFVAAGGFLPGQCYRKCWAHTSCEITVLFSGNLEFHVFPQAF